MCVVCTGLTAEGKEMIENAISAMLLGQDTMAKLVSGHRQKELNKLFRSAGLLFQLHNTDYDLLPIIRQAYEHLAESISFNGIQSYLTQRENVGGTERVLPNKNDTSIQLLLIIKDMPGKAFRERISGYVAESKLAIDKRDGFLGEEVKSPQQILEEQVLYKDKPDKDGLFRRAKIVKEKGVDFWGNEGTFSYEVEVEPKPKKPKPEKPIPDAEGQMDWVDELEAGKLRRQAPNPAQISAQIEEFSKRIFGNNSPVRIKMIEKMMTAEGQAAFGRYLDGMIEIIEGNGDIGGTYLYETVHAVMDMFLTPAERAILLKEVQKRFPKEILAYQKEHGVSIEEATEEVLAENFIAYARGRQGISGKIKILFERLLNAIKGLAGNASAIEKLYADMWGL